MGYRVVLGPHVLAREGYLAGSDALRAADLNRMFHDPSVRAVWFARGGFGTARILDHLDLRAAARNTEVLIGYSDVTALFAALHRRPRPVCLYGPVVAELGEPSSFDSASLRKLLLGESVALGFPKRGVLRAGRAEGRLFGGTLTLLVHLLGTRYLPDLKGTILFLEDTGEEAYRLDRMLTQLRMSGLLAGVRGVVLGAFDAHPPKRAFPPDRPILDLVRETFLPLDVPVVMGLQAGHVPKKRTLPLGGTARLDTAAGRLEVEVRPQVAPRAVRVQ